MNATHRPPRGALGARYDLEICPAREIAALLAEAGKGPPSAVARLAFLSDSEARLFQKLKSEKRRRDWLAGRLAAKRALARRLADQGARPPLEAIEISNLESGEPSCRLLDHQAVLRGPLSFSISHCEAGGLCAVAQAGTRVGADWETVPAQELPFLHLFAHELETNEALASSAEEQIRLWSLKEAVLKLLGLGLALDPKDIRRRGPGGHDTALELHGPARRRWTQLGSPEIAWEQRREGDAIITVACALEPDAAGG